MNDEANEGLVVAHCEVTSINDVEAKFNFLWLTYHVKSGKLGRCLMYMF